MNYSTRDGVHAPHVVRVSVTVSVCALLVLQVQRDRESEYTFYMYRFACQLACTVYSVELQYLEGARGSNLQNTDSEYRTVRPYIDVPVRADTVHPPT